MAQEFGGQAVLTQELREMLAGRRILLMGAHNKSRKWFGEKLAELSRQAEGVFAVLQGDADFVSGSKDVQECGTAAAASNMQEPDARDYVCIFGYAEDQEEQQAVLDALILAAQKKVQGAVLVSEDCVYGKCFGKQRELSEHELGYVCHTAKDDMAAAALRAAENLAYRLAKEEGAHIVIARFGGVFDDMAAVLGALVHAKPGEVYNLPHDAAECAAWQTEAAQDSLQTTALQDLLRTPISDSATDNLSDNRSVLSPIRVVTDTKKMQELIRK